METVTRLLLLFLQAYGIVFALLGAHKVRRKYGLDLYFTLLGGLIIYMWWVTRLQLDVLAIGGLKVPASSVIYFPAIFTTLLVVYISDGVRMARRLILSIVALQGLFLIIEGLTYLLLIISPPFIYSLPESFTSIHFKATFWSSIAFFIDMFVAIIVYQFLQNNTTRLSYGFMLFFALACALIVDSLVFTVGTTSGNFNSLGSLFVQMSVKIATIALMTPVISFYIKKDSKGNLQSRATLDIFKSIDLLTRSLHYTKTKYEHLTKMLPDAVFIMNTNGFIIESNQAFRKLTGFSVSLDKDLHYTRIIDPSDRPTVVSDISNLLENKGKIQPKLIKVKDYKNELKHQEIQPVIIDAELGQTGILVYLRDVHEHVQTKENLKKSDKLVALADLQSKIIKVFSTQTQKHLDLANIEEDSKDAQSEIIESLQSLIDGVVGIEGEDSDKTRVELSELIDPSFAVLGDRINSGNINIDIKYPEMMPMITCNKKTMTQLFLHLIDNATYWAIKSEKAKPEVQIIVEYRQLIHNRRMLDITIKDNGPGISEEKRQKIYDPFYSSEPGTHKGLGLSFCHHIIAEHSGKMEHKRKENETLIVVSIPMENSDSLNTKTLVG